MENKIVAGQSLQSIEKTIEEEVKSCEYWGDLELTVDELDVIKERFQTILSRDGVTISYVCKNYPHAVTTFMVFFVRYRYDTNFWTALGNEIGRDISINQHSEIGDCAKRMFRKYGMDISDTKDEPRQVIAPIIYEACLPPESSLDDLFYVMSYDRYNVFDPQLIIDELIDMRSYRIRKPMFRFLTRFKDDRAVDFMLEVRDAMISSEQHGSQISRYTESYTEWKQQEKSKTAVSNRKNQDFQTRPYLFFDNGNKGLCIILPRTIMSVEWTEEVAWTISADNGFEKTVYCRVLGDEGRRYTDSLIVSVCPSEKYTVELKDSEELEEDSYRKWEIPGINKGKALFFNSSGRQVNANYLLSPYGIMIFPKDVRITDSTSLDISEQYYPGNSAEYRIVSVMPLGDDSKLSYGTGTGAHTLTVRPQINLWLEGATLFSAEKNANVFTSIPDVHVSGDAINQYLNMEIRVGEFTYAFPLASDEEITYSLNESTIKQYGTYGVRLYQNGRFVKQVEFSYVPEIKTSYSPQIKWPDLSERKAKKTYRFKKIEDWELEFEGCNVTRDETNYTIEVSSNKGVIPVTLKSSNDAFIFECSLALPVNPFEASIVDGAGNVIDNVTDKSYKAGLEWVLENEKWLSVRTFSDFSDKNFNARLKTVNGIEQTEKIHLTQNGAGNIDLSVFNDTLRKAPLPAEIELICEDDDQMTVPIMIVTEELAMERPVKYQLGENRSYIILDILDNGKDIDVVRFGFDMKDVHIPYTDSVLGKSGKTRGYIYPGKLAEGIYVVSGSKEQSVFEFEDDNTIDLGLGNNAFLVSCRTKEKKARATIKEWIDLFVAEIMRSDSHSDWNTFRSMQILKTSNELEDLEKCPLDNSDIEKLVALAYFVNAKIANKMKSEIRRCMRLISSKFMERGDRFRIIELLVELLVPQEVFDICLDEYMLFLFYTDRTDASHLASKVEPYSVDLSMLIMMSTDGSIRDCIWRDKYRDLIGRDALRKLLSVPATDDPEIISNEQRKFIREIEGSHVRINLDDEISGNEEIIQGMIVWDTKYIRLDIKRKPEYGVYFARIKYVDQYVNWYKVNHDKKGDLNPETRVLMKSALDLYADSIQKAFHVLITDDLLGTATKQYQSAVKERCNGEINGFSYSAFFYIEGLAAYLARLPVHREDLDEVRKLGIRFMEKAFIAAPRLSRRDVLMAETYRYLKRKEELICR